LGVFLFFFFLSLFSFSLRLPPSHPQARVEYKYVILEEQDWTKHVSPDAEGIVSRKLFFFHVLLVSRGGERQQREKNRLTKTKTKKTRIPTHK